MCLRVMAETLDHAGGNENMAKAGATMIAHENVKKRLKRMQKDGTYKSK